MLIRILIELLLGIGAAGFLYYITYFKLIKPIINHYRDVRIAKKEYSKELNKIRKI